MTAKESKTIHNWDELKAGIQKLIDSPPIKSIHEGSTKISSKGTKGLAAVRISRTCRM